MKMKKLIILFIVAMPIFAHAYQIDEYYESDNAIIMF